MNDHTPECPPGNGNGTGGQAAEGLDFVWVMARGIVGLPYPGPGTGEATLIPCGTWGWIDEATTAAYVASGSVLLQPEGPVVIDFAADGCLPRTTGVTAGIPGAFVPATAVPANLVALQALGAMGETTAWTVGQNVALGDGTTAHWNGTAWAVGAAAL